ncbi:alpha/beta fold hydrolase [Shouchella patagoniensis]|uniref:alpha/beta fold hydrolase n=1 Tax=Shouchella patagoniensis TaxID=228576 RepID=UPI0014728A09|nr:alpha/beta hydrolase [Shouchella patagoniensis]
MRTLKPMKSSYYSIDNATVYFEYFTCEKKPIGTILFLHGFFSSCASFHKLIPFLLKEFDVISCDLPGFGKSSKHKRYLYSFNNYARTVIKLLDELEVQQACLIGHSMGGQVALYAAKEYPNRVQCLVLLASSGYLKRVKQRYRVASYFPFASYFVKRFIQKPDVRMVIEEAVYDKGCIDEQMVQHYHTPLLDPHFCIGLIQLSRQREGDLTSDQLTCINQRTLLLAGISDPLIPVKTSERLYHDLPNSKLVLLDKCGHLIPEERPTEVAENILFFLQDAHGAKPGANMIQ